jgi:hypothetical protein
MAHYLVTAKPKSDRLEALLKNLRDRAYASMRPFGRAMTFSLENARLRDDGYAAWEEEDYCSPPLAQERDAALDEFFDDLSVTAIQEGRGWDEVDHLPRLFPELRQSARSSASEMFASVDVSNRTQTDWLSGKLNQT